MNQHEREALNKLGIDEKIDIKGYFERILQERDRAEERFQNERDRRYAEVKSAEEKALKVKEQADRDALGLAREIQTYKDEKANELREQIASERNLYVTKGELQAAVRELAASIKPLSEHASSSQGRTAGITWIVPVAFSVFFLLATIVSIYLSTRK
jgi:vacuolar-type H+-ATPase subunit H